MNALLQNLIKLQSLEFDETGNAPDEQAVAELRSKIPGPILGHYDRLVARGKKAVAIVRDQVCCACHMHVPVGVVNTLRQGQDLQLCDSCGRYLCLPPAGQNDISKPAVAPKSAGKARKAGRILEKA